MSVSDPRSRGPSGVARRRWAIPAAAAVGAGVLTAGLFAWSTRPAAPETPGTFGLYAVWLAGAGDESRADIDRFLRCVVEGSNLNHYWEDAVHVASRSSWALPAPDSRLEWTALGAWLSAHVAAGRLPAPRAGETPVYLVFGGEPELWVGACGRNAAATVAGRRAGLAVVRNRPHCWPTRDRLRSETQIALHELVETVDRLRGDGSCAGGGACRGRAVCPSPCDTFVGLRCPGAPTATPTGCDGGQVDGWVVQSFSRAARDGGRCDACTPCDFTPRACAPDEPGCGMAAPR